MFSSKMTIIFSSPAGIAIMRGDDRAVDGSDARGAVAWKAADRGRSTARCIVADAR